MKHLLFSVLCFLALGASAQSIDALSWERVATGMDAAWYATPEAAAVADRLLGYQSAIGGWHKNIPFHRAPAPERPADIGTTFDNGATITEMQFLANVYAAQPKAAWREAFVRALGYTLRAQYDNGGWPQFFPARVTDGFLTYSSQITFNDNAMVNILQLLRHVYQSDAPYDKLAVDEAMKTSAKTAFDKGVALILAAQIKVNGQPAVWCAQHDSKTLAPVQARAYELPSFSGSESVGIVELLMSLPDPSPEVVAAVEGAVAWLDAHKIEETSVMRVRGVDGRPDTIVEFSPGANPVWARFYDLETGQPFFCGRDGIKKSSLDQIEQERRGGYAWYTTAPARVLIAYPAWKSSLR